MCSKLACPLANSTYATVREKKGKIYLYMKTIERSFTPNKLWEEIELSNNYQKALETIEECL